MDTISHGLWSLIFFSNHPKRWLAVIIGTLPDIVTFLPHLFIEHFIGGQKFFDLIYSFTHSLVIFFVVVLLIYLFTKSIPWIAGAWGIHIIFDVFTHPKNYYSTPFLYPFPSPVLPALDYRAFWFIVVNYIVIFLVLVFIFQRKRQLKR